MLKKLVILILFGLGGCDKMNFHLGSLWPTPAKPTEVAIKSVVTKSPTDTTSKLETVVFPTGETIEIPKEKLTATKPDSPVKPVRKKKQYQNEDFILWGGLIVLVCAAAVISLQKQKQRRKVKVNGPPFLADAVADRLALENKAKEKLPGLKEVSKFGPTKKHHKHKQ